MTSGKSFVTIDSIVSSILLEIGDEENRRYYVRASQWAIDAIRDLNIFTTPLYAEKKVTLDADLLTGEYPKDLVKLLSVGMYANGEFFPFTKKPNLSKPIVDAEDDIVDESGIDSTDIPEKGYKFGYQGANIGYWADDPENCRFVVKNFRWNTNNGSYSDTTSDIVTKVIVRYKTTGIDCSGDLCVPVELKSLVVALVTYKFMLKNIPIRPYPDEKDRQERVINSLQERYEALAYEPHNFYEVKDAVFSSLNTTARR